MRTLRQPDADRHDQPQTQREEPDEGVRTAPEKDGTADPDPGEQGDDFTVLLCLGLL